MSSESVLVFSGGEASRVGGDLGLWTCTSPRQGRAGRCTAAEVHVCTEKGYKRFAPYADNFQLAYSSCGAVLID